MQLLVLGETLLEKCKNFESLTLPALAVAAEENPEEITGSLCFLNGRTGGRNDFAITARS